MGIIRLTPQLRYIETDENMSSLSPCTHLPGYPENGSTFFKLQQAWEDIEDGSLHWKDVEIDYSA